MFEKWIDNQWRKYAVSIKKDLVQSHHENTSLLRKIEKLEEENADLKKQLQEWNIEIERLNHKVIDTLQQVRSWQRSYRDMMNTCETLRIEYMDKMNGLLGIIKDFYREEES